MSDDRQQTSDEWDAMVKRKAREYQAPDSTPPAMTDHAQRAHVIVECFRQDDSDDYDNIYAHVEIAIEKALDEVATQAHAAGRREGFEEAGQAQDVWQNNRAEFYRRYRHNSFGDWCRAKMKGAGS